MYYIVCNSYIIFTFQCMYVCTIVFPNCFCMTHSEMVVLNLILSLEFVTLINTNLLTYLHTFVYKPNKINM